MAHIGIMEKKMETTIYIAAARSDGMACADYPMELEGHTRISQG